MVIVLGIAVLLQFGCKVSDYSCRRWRAEIMTAKTKKAMNMITITNERSQKTLKGTG